MDLKNSSCIYLTHLHKKMSLDKLFSILYQTSITMHVKCMINSYVVKIILENSEVPLDPGIIVTGNTEFCYTYALKSGF